MLNKTKDKKRNITLFHIIFTVVMLYVTFILIKQELNIRELNLEKVKSTKTLSELNKDVKDLESKVKNTNSMQYIEKIAREELKMIKPNEIIYIDKNKHKDGSFTD